MASPSLLNLNTHNPPLFMSTERNRSGPSPRAVQINARKIDLCVTTKKCSPGVNKISSHASCALPHSF